MDEYYALSNAGEAFYKAKSRVLWLKEGDKNSAFFHRKMTTHIAQNKILRVFGYVIFGFFQIICDKGVWITRQITQIRFNIYLPTNLPRGIRNENR